MVSINPSFIMLHLNTFVKLKKVILKVILENVFKSKKKCVYVSCEEKKMALSKDGEIIIRKHTKVGLSWSGARMRLSKKLNN